MFGAQVLANKRVGVFFFYYEDGTLAEMKLLAGRRWTSGLLKEGRTLVILLLSLVLFAGQGSMCFLDKFTGLWILAV